MVEQIRFGREIADLPVQLAFGDWGVTETINALDAFEVAHAYFDSEAVIKSEKDRLAVIAAARRYYDGNHVKPLKVRPNEFDDNVIINLCRTLVDDSVSRLFGNPETGVLKMDLALADKGEGLEPGEKADQLEGLSDYLESVYLKSGGFRFLKRLGVRGGISGHSFIKLVPEQNEIPKIILLNPNFCSVMVDSMDVERVKAYRIEWEQKEAGAGGRSDVFLYRQLVVNIADSDAWAVADFKAKKRKKRDWILSGGPWAWSWPWSPVLDCRNIEHGWSYYGLSDLEDVAMLNDAINFLTSNTVRILKHHAHPKTIGTGITPADVVESSIAAFWTIENPDAVIKNLEMQSDLGASLQLLNMLMTSFWSTGRGLDPSVYKDKIGTVTNFALRVLSIRAVQDMGDKRQSYGGMLMAANARLLDMIDVEGVETNIQWPDALPEDPKEQLDRLDLEIGIGITSKETASGEIGRSWELEQTRILDERKNTDTLGEYLLKNFDSGFDGLTAKKGTEEDE